MTSQGMIFNKRNLILVSDRQETMPDGKTYEGMGKIFELSPFHSAAIMVNGYADFENIPIETLIGEFKIKTDFRKIKTIEEIKNRFLTFLSNNTSPNHGIEELLENFKKELIFKIHENGFDEVIEVKSKKSVPPFVRKYSKFKDYFFDIIPENYDKTKFNQIIVT